MKKAENLNNCVLSVQCLTPGHFDSSGNRTQFSGRYNRMKKMMSSKRLYRIAATNYFALCCFLPQDPANNNKKYSVEITCKQSYQNDGIGDEGSRNQNVVLMMEEVLRFVVQN